MTIEVKHIDLIDTDYASQQQWAENTPGVFMNLLGGCRWDPIDNKYKIVPIKYSSVDLTGEKIRFANGQEFQVLYSCLAMDYANRQEIKDKWWEEAHKLVDGYKEQKQLKEHIASNNTDLKRLRKEGLLLDKDELNE